MSCKLLAIDALAFAPSQGSEVAEIVGRVVGAADEGTITVLEALLIYEQLMDD